MKRVAFAVLAAGALWFPLASSNGFPQQTRVGAAAPSLGLQAWLNSPPLEIKGLRGKVLLIRWWTDGCAFCSTTAPALRKLHLKYGDRGLQVMGIFHPKPAGDWNMERVRKSSHRLGFAFPVALDADWQALRRWWPDDGPGSWTSVSFLVDKKGVIRYVHPGGEYHEDAGGDPRHSHETCHQQYREIERTIRQLLAE